MLLYFYFTFYNCCVLMGFLPWKNRVAFPGESQPLQSRAIQPSVHGFFFNVSIVHRTLTWTTGSLTCTQMLMHAIVHGGANTVRESALKVDSGRKFSCHTGESNLRQQRAGPMLFQLSYIPTLRETTFRCALLKKLISLGLLHFENVKRVVTME